jgi:membrane-bound serine protease (ClpP class)
MVKRRGWSWVGWVVGVLLLAMGAFGQIEQPVAGGAGVVAQPLLGPQEKAALLKVDGPIDRVTLTSLERRVDGARKAGCTLVIYDMTATGGYMPSALDISAFTKRVTGEKLNVVAWVHGNAAGAASVVALSCPVIVMAEGAGIGAVGSGDQGAVMADLSDSAGRLKIDPVVLRGMADPAVELFAVSNRVTGETRYVEKAAEKALLEQTAAAPGGAVVRPWVEVGEVDGAGSTLLVESGEALKIGLSKGTVRTEADLRAALNVRGDLVPMDLNIFERVARFLALPWVRFLLLVGMLTFAWMEMSHPGISVPGVLAVLCLVLLVGGPYVTGLAQAWEILLIVVGIAIVLGDLFFVGSLGMLAVPGLVLIVVGLVASFIPAGVGGGLEMGAGLVALRRGLVVVVGALVVSVAAFVVMAKYLRMVPAFGRLQLTPAAGTRGDGTGGAVVRDAADRPVGEAVFVGALGVAQTALRPAGKAKFGEHLVNVVSFGPLIGAGTEIEVIGVSGYRVTVRPRRTAEEVMAQGEGVA